ncbi:MAG: hypothetical protein Q9169_007793 [Polycauliona sp. 2 TL-2023]
MVDAGPATVGPGGRIGIFQPFELDCYLVTKKFEIRSDMDEDLFSFDHFYKVLKSSDPGRYGLMTKGAVKEALKRAKRDRDDYFIGWDSTSHDSPRHEGARENFRRRYTAYLMSQIQVDNPLEPQGARDRIIAGLRRDLSLEQVATGLNRLYRQQGDPQRPEKTQTYSAKDVDLVQEYLKFTGDGAYVTWNEAAYHGAQMDQMVHELTR